MNKIQKVSKRFLIIFQAFGLFIIGLATAVAIIIELKKMLIAQDVTLADLLLLFIYLEVLAMIYIYVVSGKLPIRIPLYIAIVALARYLILDMKSMETWRMIAVSVSALILGVTVFVIRFGHSKYPYLKEEDE